MKPFTPPLTCEERIAAYCLIQFFLCPCKYSLSDWVLNIFCYIMMRFFFKNLGNYFLNL